MCIGGCSSEELFNSSWAIHMEYLSKRVWLSAWFDQQSYLFIQSPSSHLHPLYRVWTAHVALILLQSCPSYNHACQLSDSIPSHLSTWNPYCVQFTPYFKKTPRAWLLITASNLGLRAKMLPGASVPNCGSCWKKYFVQLGEKVGEWGLGGIYKGLFKVRSLVVWQY